MRGALAWRHFAPIARPFVARRYSQLPSPAHCCRRCFVLRHEPLPRRPHCLRIAVCFAAINYHPLLICQSRSSPSIRTITSLHRQPTTASLSATPSTISAPSTVIARRSSLLSLSLTSVRLILFNRYQSVLSVIFQFAALLHSSPPHFQRFSSLHNRRDAVFDVCLTVAGTDAPVGAYGVCARIGGSAMRRAVWYAACVYGAMRCARRAVWLTAW